MIAKKRAKNQVVLVSDEKTDYGVTTKRHDGYLTRVYPTRGRDVMLLRMLDHQREKFAPAEGGGILVTDAGMAKICPE